MKHLPVSLQRMAAQRKTAVWLLAVSLALSTGSASATCTITNAPIMLSAKLMIVGSAAISSLGRHLHASPFTSQFTIKCDADTAYNLIVSDAAGGPAVILRDELGNKVVTTIKLRSIDAKSINLDFTKMPITGYADHAIAGKLYQVVLEVTPVDTAILSAGVIAKSFSGNLSILLQY